MCRNRILKAKQSYRSIQHCLFQYTQFCKLYTTKLLLPKFKSSILLSCLIICYILKLDQTNFYSNTEVPLQILNTQSTQTVLQMLFLSFALPIKQSNCDQLELHSYLKHMYRCMIWSWSIVNVNVNF